MVGSHVQHLSSPIKSSQFRSKLKYDRDTCYLYTTTLTHNWLYFTTCLYYPLKECWDLTWHELTNHRLGTNESEICWLGTEKLEGMVDSARKIWRDGWLGTENLKGWLTRHGKFEGMVDSARKNLKGWLTRHGKTWKDGWLGTEKLEGMVDSARKNLKGWLTRHGKTNWLLIIHRH